MTNTDLVEFKTIYPDIERYLAEDCYVPNEVRDSRTGISCIQVPANTMVEEIVKTDKMAAVVVPGSRIVVFMWYDNDDGDNPDMHVLNMQYFDATDNNIEFAKKYARGTAVRGVDHIDAFDPEKDARQFAQLMSLCNGLVIRDQKGTVVTQQFIKLIDANYHEHFVNINMIVDIDKHYCLVTLANNDETLSITKESLIKLLSLIGCE